MSLNSKTRIRTSQSMSKRMNNLSRNLITLLAQMDLIYQV
jgi:predicted DNA-binding protein